MNGRSIAKALIAAAFTAFPSLLLLPLPLIIAAPSTPALHIFSCRSFSLERETRHRFGRFARSELGISRSLFDRSAFAPLVVRARVRTNKNPRVVELEVLDTFRGLLPNDTLIVTLPERCSAMMRYHMAAGSEWIVPLEQADEADSSRVELACDAGLVPVTGGIAIGSITGHRPVDAIAVQRLKRTFARVTNE